MGSVAELTAKVGLLASRAGPKSKWPTSIAVDLAGSDVPRRLEGDAGDLRVHGDFPPESDGIFYRGCQ
jgi:hypothetical protein